MRVLLVQPLTPSSYWGFQEAVKFVGATSSMPPLGLITIAALFPENWELRLVDLNIETLTEADLAWADVVLLTGMIVHRDSMRHVLEQCCQRNISTVVGGPFVSSSPDADLFSLADALVLGELEDPALLKRLVDDIEYGQLCRRYQGRATPQIRGSRVPRFDLLQISAYAAMAMQVSRGCPHLCEFCNVTELFGRRPRYKSPGCVLRELDALLATGYRGNVFIVDDNFIGNPREAKAVLEQMVEWQEQMGYPFLFYTESTILLAGMDELVELMVKAGFFAVFVGFESPSTEALTEAHKHQNLKRDPVEAVRHLREKGLLVYGGFIVGFDADTSACFSNLEEFVKAAAIDFAMVGMYNAIPGTALWTRLQAEGRLLREMHGDQFVGCNFQPKQISWLALSQGYRKLIVALYQPSAYFDRAFRALSQWKTGSRRQKAWREYFAVLRSFVKQGVVARYRNDYWRFLYRVYRASPEKLPRAFAIAISFHHFALFTTRLDADLADREHLMMQTLLGALPPSSEVLTQLS